MKNDVREGRRLVAVGVDGAPGGWIAAACWAASADVVPPADRRTELHFFPDISALADWRSQQPGGDTAPVAVDMPIGLPDVVGYRVCDQAARDRLPAPQNAVGARHPGAGWSSARPSPTTANHPRPRSSSSAPSSSSPRSSSAWTPRRRSLGEQAKSLLRLTQQAAGILGKVAEVDTFMRAGSADDQRRHERWHIEVHPEMCFQAMAGVPAMPPKPSAHEQLQRSDAVCREFAEAEARIRAWERGHRYSLLDICDAHAACWSALRWGLHTRRRC